MGDTLDRTLAVLNGLLGDHLARTGNGLATEMGLYRNGSRIRLSRDGIASAYPQAGSRVAVLVHGILCDERSWTLPDGSDYGSLLARDLGYTPLYVRYNTGRAIADNGADLARLLDRVVKEHPVPVEEILFLGYSMGGLLVRSACHEAGRESSPWLGRVRRAIYVGTPHLGAPAERGGRTFAKLMQAIDDPYTRLIADIGNLRSAGIKDLGDAVLRHEDREQDWADDLRDARHPVPLLPQIAHYLIAGAISSDPWITRLFGDAIVPVASATLGSLAAGPGAPAPGARGEGAAAAPVPPSRVRLFPGRSHLALQHDTEVYEQIRAFCEEPLPCPT